VILRVSARMEGEQRDTDSAPTRRYSERDGMRNIAGRDNVMWP
jgi:hypothetical protein